jgi:hypothetical protein
MCSQSALSAALGKLMRCVAGQIMVLVSRRSSIARAFAFLGKPGTPWSVRKQPP